MTEPAVAATAAFAAIADPACCSAGVVSCAGPADPAQLQAGGNAVHRAQSSRGGRGAGASGARADAGEHVHVDNEVPLAPTTHAHGKLTVANAVVAAQHRQLKDAACVLG